MRGIGEVARASGLSVSALRFYDGAGVLVPAAVDPGTGYRRYGDGQIRAARLIAGLRRVGLPVAEIARAVQEPLLVREILALHRQKLAAGYAGALRELSRLEALIDLEESLMTRVTLSAAEFAAALAAVRFAASSDPDLPILGGVLVEAEAGALLVVATDRYRLASARVPAGVDGPPVRAVLPMSFVDAAGPELTGDAPVTLDLTGQAVQLGAVAGTPLTGDYPDIRRVLDTPREGLRSVPVEVAELRASLARVPSVTREHEGLAYEISVLGLDPAGALRVVAGSEWAADADNHVAVRREFLLEALDAGGAGQLRLELDGPIHPLIVRGNSEQYSLLMPVRY
jgi:DNA polymerase III subunit beta